MATLRSSLPQTKSLPPSPAGYASDRPRWRSPSGSVRGRQGCSEARPLSRSPGGLLSAIAPVTKLGGVGERNGQVAQSQGHQNEARLGCFPPRPLNRSSAGSFYAIASRNIGLDCATNGPSDFPVGSSPPTASGRLRRRRITIAGADAEVRCLPARHVRSFRSCFP